MSLGPVIADIEGTSLNAEDRKLLSHPNVGGIILFSRNFESVEQLCELTTELHALRKPRLLVGADQEGGRVQRFRSGFTALPPMAVYGSLFAEDKNKARALAETHGWLAAVELLASGVDLSFAPVLDLRRTATGVIGDRAFDHNPEIVSQLAAGLVRGMTRAGMAAVGKHFPGHGGVKEDTHLQAAEDKRPLSALQGEDLLPFKHMIKNGLAGLMTNHLSYPLIDKAAVTYSSFWLREYLRGKLGFNGVIFSDDLGMAAAKGMGTPLQCAQAALSAGCDMVLPCNNREACTEVVFGLGDCIEPSSQMRYVRLHGKRKYNWTQLRALPEWQRARETLLELNISPELDV